MIGTLVELSAEGQRLQICEHLIGLVGLVTHIDEGESYYWIDWSGIEYNSAYKRWNCSKTGRRMALYNGLWKRRDFKIAKKTKKILDKSNPA